MAGASPSLPRDPQLQRRHFQCIITRSALFVTVVLPRATPLDSLTHLNIFINSDGYNDRYSVVRYSVVILPLLSSVVANDTVLILVLFVISGNISGNISGKWKMEN